MLTRRTFLASAGTATLAAVMPRAAARPPLDREALRAIADHVHETFTRWSDEQTLLLRMVEQFSGFAASRDAWIHETTLTTDCALRASFGYLLSQSREQGYEVPALQDGELSSWWQLTIMGLPLAPCDYAPGLFPKLAKLAPHYLV